MKRESGIRQFSEREIEALHVIECLKASELGIREIKQFMVWCTEGPSKYIQRKELFEIRKAAVEKEMAELQKTLDMIRFKCWYYEQAISDGNEKRIQEMLPDHLPPEIQEFYDHGHS